MSPGSLFTVSNFIANYNSLQSSLTRRMAHGFQIQASYTWSKNLDEVNGEGGTDLYELQLPTNDQRDLRTSYGPAGDDRTHRAVVSFTWFAPKFASMPRPARLLMTNWQFSGIGVAQSGNPLTIVDFNAGSVYGNLPGETRAQLSGGGVSTRGSLFSRVQGHYLDAGGFTRAPEVPHGTSLADQDFGNSGVGIIRGPGQHNIDLAVERLFPITERIGFRFRTEFFNLTNTPQFSNPNTGLGYGDPNNPTPTASASLEGSHQQPRIRALSNSLQRLFSKRKGRRRSAMNLQTASRRRIVLAVFVPLCVLAMLSVTPLHGGILQRGKVQLICHRTANRDMPENTLESLELAARMGCNLVEIDIRRTLDGQLVLNHDDFLERLTPAMGNVELTSYDELKLLDTGGWMGKRFAHMSIPLFVDALRVARKQNIGLYLDIKTPNIGPLIIAALHQEGMLERVIFGGEWSDIPALYPKANADPSAWVEPGVASDKVATLHQQGKFVVANFSANAHEMDLDLMRAAVAAGVDAINVDYPRLGADAVGRPVEGKVALLVRATCVGNTVDRERAIFELSRYTGFPTQSVFERLLHDSDDRISHAAALALVLARPATPSRVFVEALSAHGNNGAKECGLGPWHARAVCFCRRRRSVAATLDR